MLTLLIHIFNWAGWLLIAVCCFGYCSFVRSLFATEEKLKLLYLHSIWWFPYTHKHTHSIHYTLYMYMYSTQIDDRTWHNLEFSKRDELKPPSERQFSIVLPSLGNDHTHSCGSSYSVFRFVAVLLLWSFAYKTSLSQYFVWYVILHRVAPMSLVWRQLWLNGMTQSMHDVLIKVLQIPCAHDIFAQCWMALYVGDGGDGFRCRRWWFFSSFLACCLSVWFMRIWFFTGALCTHPHATCREFVRRKKQHFACTKWSSLAFHLPCNNNIHIYLDTNFSSLNLVSHAFAIGLLLALVLLIILCVIFSSTVILLLMLVFSVFCILYPMDVYVRSLVWPM